MTNQKEAEVNCSIRWKRQFFLFWAIFLALAIFGHPFLRTEYRKGYHVGKGAYILLAYRNIALTRVRAQEIFDQPGPHQNWNSEFKNGVLDGADRMAHYDHPKPLLYVQYLYYGYFLSLYDDTEKWIKYN